MAKPRARPTSRTTEYWHWDTLRISLIFTFRLIPLDSPSSSLEVSLISSSSSSSSSSSVIFYWFMKKSSSMSESSTPEITLLSSSMNPVNPFPKKTPAILFSPSPYDSFDSDWLEDSLDSSDAFAKSCSFSDSLALSFWVVVSNEASSFIYQTTDFCLLIVYELFIE